MSVIRGAAKLQTLLFYGRIDRLTWDPHRFQWQGSQGRVPFLHYSAKLGRELLRDKHPVPDVIQRKWQGILPLSHRLQWKTIWIKYQTPKEASLLWLVWHRAVAVNAWRASVNPAIPTGYPVCPRHTHESILHRFWECPNARHAWQWGIHIANTLTTSRDAQGPWRPLTWKQGIFSDRIPRKFNGISSLWAVLRTTILWTLWIEWNDASFNDILWRPGKQLQKIWLSLVDYGCLEWVKCCSLIRNQPDKAHDIRNRFSNRWCRNGVLATMVNGIPRWRLTGPRAGFVFEPP